MIYSYKQKNFVHFRSRNRNAFENVVCEMAAILSRHQWINQHFAPLCSDLSLALFTTYWFSANLQFTSCDMHAGFICFCFCGYIFGHFVKQKSEPRTTHRKIKQIPSLCDVWEKTSKVHWHLCKMSYAHTLELYKNILHRISRGFIE